MSSTRPNGNRVHVVHVIGSLQTGGAEKMLLNFIGAADRERFRHTILCLTAEGDMAGEVAETGADLKVMPVRFRTFPRDVGRMVRWFRAEDVRVVHSHMFFASLWSRIAGLRAGVPVLVTTEHGKEPWKKAWQIRLDGWLSRRTFHHIAVSEDVRNIRIERDGVDPARITMIPNGVPIPADADLATPDGARVRAQIRPIDEQDVARLERWIDRLDGELEPLKWFVLPGGDPAAATLHVARAVVRRAEREVIAAAALLEDEWNVAAEVWSVTSFTELRREGLEIDRWNRLHPSQEPRVPRVAQLLGASGGPITAVSDFMAIVPEQIQRFVHDRTFVPLGTDGMGRSDTREALRRHFEVDTGHVVLAVLDGLLADGRVDESVVEDAIARYDIDPDAIDPYLS